MPTFYFAFPKKHTCTAPNTRPCEPCTVLSAAVPRTCGSGQVSPRWAPGPNGVQVSGRCERSESKRAQSKRTSNDKRPSTTNFAQNAQFSAHLYLHQVQAGR